MKVRVQRLSIRQNAKLFAIFSALWSLIFMVPMTYYSSSLTNEPPRFFAFSLIFYPVAHLIIGYILTVISFWIYNLLSKYIGGIEFELKNVEMQARISSDS